MTPHTLLTKAQQAFTTAFQKFSLIARENRSSIVCFVEGQDMDYYKIRIEAFSGDYKEFIPCGNKKNVLAMYTRLNSTYAYNGMRLLYFVDQDYDDNSDISDDIFVTDGYSVENYYGSFEVVKNILDCHCHLNPDFDRERYDKIKDLYDNWKAQFIAMVKPFCAWYKVAHDRNLQGDKKYKEHFPKKYGEISLGNIIPKAYDYNILNADYCPSPFVTEDEFLKSELTIEELEQIRGKYVIEFIFRFICHLDVNAKKNSKYLTKKVNFSAWNANTLLSVLSSCAITTNRLRIYIKNKV